MEKLILLAFLLGIITTSALSQAPGKMSYQAVVRNNQGDLVTNQSVTVRIQILKDSEFGAASYVEVHQAITNENGLVSLVIGEGTVNTGNIASIEWDAGAYFLKVEIDPNGGSSYVISGTSQLMSVPYALYAESSGGPWLNNQADIIHYDAGQVVIGQESPLGSFAKLTLKGNMAFVNEFSNTYFHTLIGDNGIYPGGAFLNFDANGGLATHIYGGRIFNYESSLKTSMTQSTSGAGYINTIGSNGSNNVILTNLAANGSNGFVALVNSSGDTKAGIYVNASNQGQIFGDVKSFKMDNPLDDKTSIVYACIEGPEAGAYERGTTQLSQGEAFVSYSEHYQIVVNPETVTVHLTPHSADTYGLAVVEKTATGFKVKELKGGDGSFSFDWKVEGKRKGYENYNPIQSNENFEYSKAVPEELPTLRNTLPEE